MSNNAQKTHPIPKLNLFAQRKALDEIGKRGSSLPGHVVSIAGSIVTVAFDVTGITLDQIVMPVFGPEYIRYPIQEGDKGVAFPCSLYIGGVSDLGDTPTADTELQGNLSTLVWFPIASKKWTSAGVDPDQVTIYGPNGVKVQDSQHNAYLDLQPNDVKLNSSGDIEITADTQISITVGGVGIVITASGVTIQGKPFLTHHHTGVTTGGSNTGNVT